MFYSSSFFLIMHQCILRLSCISMKDHNEGLIFFFFLIKFLFTFHNYNFLLSTTIKQMLLRQKRICCVVVRLLLVSIVCTLGNYLFRPQFCKFLNFKNISILFFLCQMLMVCIFFFF